VTVLERGEKTPEEEEKIGGKKVKGPLRIRRKGRITKGFISRMKCGTGKKTEACASQASASVARGGKGETI